MKYTPQIIELADGTKCVYLEDFRRESDEAREAIRALAEHGESEIQRITKERDEALKELEEYRSIAENIGAEKAISEKEKAIRERDEAKKKYDIEATEHMLNINKCCNQRDDAIDALMKIEDRCVDGEDACDDIQKIREIAVKVLEEVKWTDSPEEKETLRKMFELQKKIVVDLELKLMKQTHESRINQTN